MARPVAIDQTSDLSRSLAQGSLALAQDLFSSAGAATPLVLWSPTYADFRDPLLTAFARLCDGVSTDGRAIPAAAVADGALDALQDWTMLVDVEDDGGAFVYRHYGAGIAEHYGQDLTGRRSSDFASHIAEFFTAVYRAALDRRERALTEHEPPGSVFVSLWRRLLVPVETPDGRITGFAVANLPENGLREGLELIVDPVFLVDEAGSVRFANRAAEESFGLAPGRATGHNLYVLTRLALPVGLTPAALRAGPRRLDHDEIVEQGGMLERATVTVSTVAHRGRCDFVVMIRRPSA